jgi:hypothetical protein
MTLMSVSIESITFFFKFNIRMHVHLLINQSTSDHRRSIIFYNTFGIAIYIFNVNFVESV